MVERRIDMSEEDVKDTILDHVRTGLGALDESFNPELLIHINIGAYDLHQNDVIRTPDINATSIISDIVFDSNDENAVLSYLTIQTKLLFDSPAPSMVGTYNSTLERLNNRLHLSRYNQKEVK